MMDNILHIVPYTAEHGQFILSCQMNHKVLEADKNYINIAGNAKNLEQDDLAFTGLIGKKPIFAAGMKMIWGQVAEGWVIATQDVWNHPLSVAKAIKKDFARVAKENNITLMNEMGYTVSEYVYYFDKALDLAVKNNIAKYKPVSLLTKPTKYANEDPKVLTDGALGGSSFYSNWLGFVDNDMDAIVDLEKERFINSITTSFLQVTNHVVFFPPSVEFLISNDNKNWKSIGKIDNQSKLSKKSKVNDIQVFETNINTTARYIRVLAQNYGDAPYWHHAAGQPSWIFSDEIIIE